VAMAKSDFAAENPGVELVQAGIRKQYSERTLVYVRFVHTPATALPRKAGIWERELLYESADGQWRCVETRGDTYIRPAR
jgi:hypothetical protein